MSSNHEQLKPMTRAIKIDECNLYFHQILCKYNFSQDLHSTTQIRIWLILWLIGYEMSKYGMIPFQRVEMALMTISNRSILFWGARDKSEYNQWQDNVQMEKKVAAETKKAENIIKAKITREEAILAKQREIDQKHAETEELKEEKAELMRRKGRLFDLNMPDRLKFIARNHQK